MSELPYAGYPGLVWATCWQSMQWLSGVLASGTTNVKTIVDPTRTVFQTLKNAVYSLDAYQTGIVLGIEEQNLLGVQALSIHIDPTTTAFMNARISSVAAAASGALALAPSVSPFNAVALLTQGIPAVPDPGFIEWCMAFNAESLVTSNPLPQSAFEMSQAWLNVVNAISVLQGGPMTTAYDTAARQYRCSNAVAVNLNKLQSGPFLSNNIVLVPMLDSAGNPMFDSDGNPLFTTAFSSSVWNAVVALPTILLDSASLSSAPSTLYSQQTMSIRYALISQMQSLASLLLSLRVHNVTQPVTANLRNNESLADLAARTTGNFEDWVEFAELNQISPPYPGPTNQKVALSGQTLFLYNGTSTPGVTPNPDNSFVSYSANVLGTDWTWGPINGRQLTWAGDIPLITGLFNFARAIGRRLQTPVGTLIYHPGYGSRIPPEVGAIQDATEAARLNQYGVSAINADPRTGAVLSSLTTVTPSQFAASFSAVVQPIGPGATPVSINEVIGGVP